MAKKEKQTETQAPAATDQVPTFTLRADNPVHFAVLIELMHRSHYRPDFPDLERTVREWELFREAH